MKKSFLFPVALLLLLFSSCEKSNPDISVEAIADVFIKTFKHNGQNAFNTVYSVSSYRAMSGVNVTVPGGPSVKLSDISGNGSTFYKDTSMVAANAYNNVPPVQGTYSYQVTFKDGEQKVFTNVLGTDYILPPVIDSLYKKPNTQVVRFKWKPVDGADAYQIRVSSGQNEIIPWMQFVENQFYYERHVT